MTDAPIPLIDEIAQFLRANRNSTRSASVLAEEIMALPAFSKVRIALKPFAGAAFDIDFTEDDKELPDNLRCEDDMRISEATWSEPSVGDCRRARAAYKLLGGVE